MNDDRGRPVPVTRHDNVSEDDCEQLDVLREVLVTLKRIERILAKQYGPAS